jgi:hypothetical protein
VTSKTYLTGLEVTTIIGFDGHEGSEVLPMIVVLQEGSDLGLRRVRWRDRLMARVRASALDEQLAAGVSPEQSVPLALHAARLCQHTHRRVLARSLTRLVAAADVPAGSRLKTPVCRGAVQQARAELAAVAGRLTASGPVEVRGVARVRTLLADGTGPLYQPAPAGQLRHELAGVLSALDSFD